MKPLKSTKPAAAISRINSAKPPVHPPVQPPKASSQQPSVKVPTPAMGMARQRSVSLSSLAESELSSDVSSDDEDIPLSV